MSSDIYNLLDELAARGRRLRGQLPGDYKPVSIGDPLSEAWVHLYPLVLSWSAREPDIPWEQETE
jgi:hypothetical protein